MVERAKWSDIAAALPGRSPASCRSQWHYQGHEEKEKRKEEREKEIEEQNRLVMEEMRKSNEKDKDRMAADWGNCEWSEYLKTEFAYTYERCVSLSLCSSVSRMESLEMQS